MQSNLTSKQSRFVDEYLIDSNATQAAVRAGYSKKTAYSQGHRLLKNVEVAEFLGKARAEVAEKARVSTAWLVEQAAANHEQAIRDGDLYASCAALNIVGKAIGAFDHRRRADKMVQFVVQ